MCDLYLVCRCVVASPPCVRSIDRRNLPYLPVPSRSTLRVDRACGPCVWTVRVDHARAEGASRVSSLPASPPHSRLADARTFRAYTHPLPPSPSPSPP